MTPMARASAAVAGLILLYLPLAVGGRTEGAVRDKCPSDRRDAGMVRGGAGLRRPAGGCPDRAGPSAEPLHIPRQCAGPSRGALGRRLLPRLVGAMPEHRGAVRRARGEVAAGAQPRPPAVARRPLRQGGLRHPQAPVQRAGRGRLPDGPPVRGGDAGRHLPGRSPGLGRAAPRRLASEEPRGRPRAGGRRSARVAGCHGGYRSRRPPGAGLQVCCAWRPCYGSAPSAARPRRQRPACAPLLRARDAVQGPPAAGAGAGHGALRARAPSR
mmetsp:Transcript_22208/g.66222  ORF Transcript_22208/g.66222 Transcript_22208/m.66222 type:complete len:270 (-) Transcript_22208:12-821(-)